MQERHYEFSKKYLRIIMPITLFLIGAVFVMRGIQELP